MIFDRVVVFVGPTVRRDIVLSKIDADVFGPAALGDVYRAAKEEPRAILIIDGTFENNAAVFHKKILWALHQGIHVFGSSSIGALRAAELHPFGMIGVGEVFESYRDGRLTEDDAVAVLHGPAELGWSQVTRALVDINATLRHAEHTGTISSTDRVIMEQAAKSLFWKERTFERVLDQAIALGWPHQQRQSILSWWIANEISQKAKDAHQLIEYVSAQWEALEEPFKADFQFEGTSVWQALKTEVDSSPRSLQKLGDQERSLKLETQALIHVLLRESFKEEAVDSDEFDSAALELRRTLNLNTGKQVLDWLQNAGLGHSDYKELIKSHLLLQKFRARHANSIRAETSRLLRAEVDARSIAAVSVPKSNT